MKPESGIEGNLPEWPGASAVYSRAYKEMKEKGPDRDLIKALNEGDEEKIKGILMYYYTPGKHVKAHNRMG
jgi:hypothetical protein